MSQKQVHIRELAAWGFDDYEFRAGTYDRTKPSQAAHLVARRTPFQQPTAVLAQESAQWRDTLLQRATRPDLLDEMTGLTWSLGIVDLRSLLAFQRRLSFNPAFPHPPAPEAQDWPALLDFSFGPVKPVHFDRIQGTEPHTLVLQSTNPNLHLRTTVDAASPLSVHAGGPFFEVASYRDRWFLRDGYHRAYTLLQAGVFEVPAVIVHANTIEELGATKPWFFSEDVLFSETPPLVLDFLNDELVLEYNRPPLIKTLRITMEETLTPATSGDQS